MAYLQRMDIMYKTVTQDYPSYFDVGFFGTRHVVLILLFRVLSSKRI
jgi:hypothetical protein